MRGLIALVLLAPTFAHAEIIRLSCAHPESQVRATVDTDEKSVRIIAHSVGRDMQSDGQLFYKDGQYAPLFESFSMIVRGQKRVDNDSSKSIARQHVVIDKEHIVFTVEDTPKISAKDFSGSIDRVEGTMNYLGRVLVCEAIKPKF